MGKKNIRPGFVFLLLMLLFSGWVHGADLPADPAAIREEMIKIRRATNWNDAKAAKEANQKIKQLTGQLETLRLKKEAVKAGASPAEAAEAAGSSIINRVTVLEKVQQAAEGNQGPSLTFNNELRQQIIKEYQEERDPRITGKAYLEEATTLVINVETSEGQAALKQLGDFTSIRRLFISGGRLGAPINLEDVFVRAQKLPLEELQIYNFRTFISSIPESISNFKALTTLGLFNNNLRTLPAAIESLGSLTTLLLDVNPIPSILSVVKNLGRLQELGLVRTGVPAEEISRIRRALPECKVIAE